MGPRLGEPGSFTARENLQKENEHHPFPLRHGAKGRQEHDSSANERCMEGGVKFDPSDVPEIVLLSGQNLGDEVIPVKEPLTAENVENLENRDALNPRGGVGNLWRGGHRANSRRAEGGRSGGRGSATAGVGRERVKTHSEMMMVRSKKLFDNYAFSTILSMLFFLANIMLCYS